MLMRKIYICFKNDITGKGYETYYNLVRKSEDISEDSKTSVIIFSTFIQRQN